MKTLVLVSLLLAGCASVFDTPFAPEFDRGPNVKMEYVYVDTQKELYKWCGQPREGRSILGCAKVPPHESIPCYVITYKNHLPDVKEHEEKHCRYGKWHPVY